MSVKKKRNRVGKESKYYVSNSDLYQELVNFDKSGECSDRLARMIMLLVDKYATHPWFNGYSYVEEMKANAILKIFEKLDKFDIHTYMLSFESGSAWTEQEVKHHVEDRVGSYGTYDTFMVIDKAHDDDNEPVEYTGERYKIVISFKSSLYLDKLKELVGEDVKPRYGNVHAYFTTIARREFQKYKAYELNQRKARDEILKINELDPSYSHDIDDSYKKHDGECVVTTY